MAHFPIPQQHIRKGALALVSVLIAMLLLSACGGDPQAQQQANQSKTAFDNEISHAQSIGIPVSMLEPIIGQAAALDSTSAPLGIFNDQPVTNYNTNLAQRYQMLTLEIKGLEAQGTQQLDYQASQDLQTLATALAVRQSQNFIEAKTFANQLTDYQAQLAKAQFPKDYILISQEARSSTEALHLMEPAYADLTSLQQVIKQLQASHLDTTALNQQAQGDLQTFRGASRPNDFSQLIDQINTQLQETTVYSIQAIPFVGAAKLNQFSADISQLKSYGVNTSTYQQRLTADQQALTNAKNVSDFLKLSAQIDNDTASIQFPLVQGEANYLLKQFHQEVTSWGKTHQYHDAYDGGAYNLDYEYDQQGIGSDADAAVQSSQTLDDYQSDVDLLNNDILLLHAMEADYSDKTPWNKQHVTDISLMQHYGVYGASSGPVLVVSLIEQTLRYYNNGKLVRSFQVVTGQYLKPSPPGFWSIFLREHPTEFKSSEPPGSAFWYPPTPIQYAMEYHAGGYFFHDSWWRGTYGSGMNFPHSDPSSPYGTTTFNDNGSHGCINMNPNDVAWLYSQIPWGTPVILY
ncbi:MAG TPA: L,D-transpeptidase family protein [Ktedonobacteraceae bacterium]|nr:L,D-transpeptidase family protein [Ktedonobacteraceae bacterium]